MRRLFDVSVAAVGGLSLLVLALSSQAQQQPTAPQQPQFPNMTFFITSAGPGKGADLGGLDGADAHCAVLAARHGAGGKNWRAYLSQQAVDGKPAVNARDRIGKGPWVNAAGTEIAANVDDLHDPAKNKINGETGMAENGKLNMTRLHLLNQHDILTGSDENGRALPADKDMTCGNWTKSGDGAAMVGHHDRMGLNDSAQAKSWNASHPSRGCSMDQLKASGGAAQFYCFVAN
jgi:hypothetical protein